MRALLTLNFFFFVFRRWPPSFLINCYTYTVYCYCYLEGGTLCLSALEYDTVCRIKCNRFGVCSSHSGKKPALIDTKC